MPTDEERREVADRLWRHIGKPLFTGQDVEDIIGVQRSDFDAVLADASYRRLADLIEPEERTCRMEPTGDGSVVCSACRTEYTSRWLHDGEYVERYCPNCGAKVVDQ